MQLALLNAAGKAQAELKPVGNCLVSKPRKLVGAHVVGAVLVAGAAGKAHHGGAVGGRHRGAGVVAAVVEAAVRRPHAHRRCTTANSEDVSAGASQRGRSRSLGLLSFGNPWTWSCCAPRVHRAVPLPKGPAELSQKGHEGSETTSSSLQIPCKFCRHVLRHAH